MVPDGPGWYLSWQRIKRHTDPTRPDPCPPLLASDVVLITNSHYLTLSLSVLAFLSHSCSNLSLQRCLTLRAGAPRCRTKAAQWTGEGSGRPRKKLGIKTRTPLLLTRGGDSGGEAEGGGGDVLTGRKQFQPLGGEEGGDGRGGRAGGWKKKNRRRKEVENREKKSHLVFRHVAAATKTQEANLFLLRCCRKVQQLPRRLGAALTRLGKINNTGPRSLPR